MKTVFVVDDNDVNLLTAENSLSKQYRVFTLPSASAMFELLEEVVPDLILLDILMPETNGFDALRMLKGDTRYFNIPVIFLTSRSDSTTEALGFEMGAVDFISKPFSEPVLLNRIKCHLKIEDIINERTYYLNNLRDSIVIVLANMVENRDILTGKHIQRTSIFLRILLEEMIKRGIYSDEIIDMGVDSLVSSARLHDLGKILIPDLILNKPGKLNDEEYEIIKTHAAEGDRIIDCIIAESGDESFLQNAKLFAGFHHERWDGTGYPYGLKGEEIPIHGRVMAIADVYDALVSARPYKPAFTHEKAVQIISEGKGTQFDPLLTDIFMEINEKFAQEALCL
ncbi:MAG: response regulator [Oscillospiraceae bacterium]|jgi:putative two-component system response regulator|nr:response regulator [Oscillospiraceae bacterium]